jgi:hypothetical protein
VHHLLLNVCVRLGLVALAARSAHLAPTALGDAWVPIQTPKLLVRPVLLGAKGLPNRVLCPALNVVDATQGLVALAAGLVRLASTALAAITLHAAAVAPTSPAHLNLLVWIFVCAQQDMA